MGLLRKNNERGATLTGYALILSAFTVLSLGAVEGLNTASESYLTETSYDIAASREISVYDDLEEIDGSGGDGGETGDDDGGVIDYVADGLGQFKSNADGLCMTQVGNLFEQQTCDGSPEQTLAVFTDFAADPDVSEIRIDGQCVGLKNNSGDALTRLEVQGCDSDNVNQLFVRNGERWESAAFPGMCLDVNGGAGGEGEPIQLYGCHTGENQKWPDPTIYVPPVTSVPDPTLTGGATFQGTIAAGTDLSPDGANQSDDNAFVFSESIIVVPVDIEVGGVDIEAGTTVCSYIVWYDPANTTDGQYAIPSTIDFGKPILAGAGSTSELNDTNIFAVAGVTYDYGREWEGDDGFNVSGTTVGIDPYAVPGNADMLRVLTDCSS